MTMLINTLAAVAAGTALAMSAFAQSARDIRAPTPLVAIQNEPPAKLIVDPPIPDQLALGRVFIQYRTENLRIMPVFGNAALAVSPRLGHLHYYVDGQSWPTVDTSGETVVLVGLKPGPHKVQLELADATHKPIPGGHQPGGVHRSPSAVAAHEHEGGLPSVPCAWCESSRLRFHEVRPAVSVWIADVFLGGRRSRSHSHTSA
jgi:hypothetical protein